MRPHHVFVPARAPEAVQGELNALLANARLLVVHRQWLDDGAHGGGIL